MRFIPFLAAAAALVSGPAFAAAAKVPGQGTWETTLQARDLDGDTVTDAYYDTVIDVTWLRKADAIKGATWTSASLWADALVVGTLDDWRLPAAIDIGAPGCSVPGQGDCGTSLDLSKSELAHLYFATLGNTSVQIVNGAPVPGTGFTNYGPFSGLQSDSYWVGAAMTAPYEAFAFYVNEGAQYVTIELANQYAVAVRDGDVPDGYIPGGVPAPIPEPASLLLMLAGVAAVASTVRKRSHV